MCCGAVENGTRRGNSILERNSTSATAANMKANALDVETKIMCELQVFKRSIWRRAEFVAQATPRGRIVDSKAQ